MKVKNNSVKNIEQILIAEDSPTQAEQLRYTLEKYNYKVTVTKDGKEALRMAIKNKPSLVISDILMPEMNGYELCKEIKSDKSAMDIPVILLTSLSESEDVLEGIACGADDFITKPYSENYLISHIEQILANGRINKNEQKRIKVEIVSKGKKRFITASQRQMLTLLISTYEAAVQRNNELVQTQNELKTTNEHLEDLVAERTSKLTEEITIRKQAEELVIKINRVYALLSSINQAIIRIHNIEHLFKKVCQIAVDKGKFLSSWIGIRNIETKKIEISASAGLKNDLINLDIKQNPISTVTDSGKYFISNDIKSDNSISGIWKQSSLSLGFKSFSIFPIKVFGKVKGSFCIYSDELNFFDEIEINLLDEMSGDISFALEYVQKESERKQAEAALKISEEKFRTIFNNANDGMFLLDIETRKLTMCNTACSKILGYTYDEFIKLDIADLHPSEEVPFILGQIDKTFGGEEDIRYNIRFKCKDNSNIIAELSQTLVTITDKKAMLIVFRDITERIKIEEELRRHREHLEELVEMRTSELQISNKKLIESNKNLESFSYSVSHDLKAPLRAINGFTEMIIEDYGKNMETELKRLFSVIVDNSKKMGQLIEDLLNLSRIGRREVSFAEVNMNKIVKKTIEELKDIYKKHNIEWIIGNLPPCKGDEILLYQVYMNLLSNAVKFTRLRPKAIIKIGCKRSGRDSIYYVNDNGVGFDMKYADKIFNVFQRLHTESEFEGTGVGLAIVKQVIEKHNGEIWVESAVNTGTTFSFKIKI
jgi:PAS domain S-box-containing protein